MNGKILKGIAGQYTVLVDGNQLPAVPLGNLKKDGLIVGDNVTLKPDEYSSNLIVTGVLPRTNQIIRPKVANIDQLIIVIAPKPKPDLLLVDKLILNAFINNIEPVILINKSDIAKNNFIDDITKQYKNVAKVVLTSATDNQNIDELKDLLKNKTSVFAGQSAVGKSSLLNAIDVTLNQSTNVLSKKVERGKHTTRVCSLFVLDNNILIADTPGFSVLDLDFKYTELKNYYPEFEGLNCEYKSCTHTKESNCKVKEFASNNAHFNERYLRYVTLFDKLKDKWEREYD